MSYDVAGTGWKKREFYFIGKVRCPLPPARFLVLPNSVGIYSESKNRTAIAFDGVIELLRVVVAMNKLRRLIEVRSRRIFVRRQHRIHHKHRGHGSQSDNHGFRQRRQLQRGMRKPPYGHGGATRNDDLCAIGHKSPNRISAEFESLTKRCAATIPYGLSSWQRFCPATL